LVKENSFSTTDGLHTSIKLAHILDKVFSCDEALFHLSGYLNSQDSRIRSAENPHAIHGRHLHTLKVRVWCACLSTETIGPIVFNETITAKHYQELIMNFISLLEAEEQDC
jgi:hypothetical protein